MRLGAALAGVMLAAPAWAQEVGPFVIDPSAAGFTVVWETDDDVPQDFGMVEPAVLDLAVETEARGERFRHRGTISSQEPIGAVTYQVNGVSHVVQIPQDNLIRLAFISDAQLDTANPTAWEQVAAEIGALHDSSPLHGLVIAGDAVDEPGDPSQFDDFFRMGRELLHEVPVLAVPGNDDGVLEALEVSVPWAVDFGPVRLLGLDTRVGSRTDGQLDWLDDQLGCAPQYVVGVMHHPAVAELFTPDNNPFSADIVEQLGEWATACDSASAHVFGAAHGYSRGESRDHRHVRIGAGSAGGPLDAWGTEPQAPAEEIGISRPEYGFVVLEADATGMRWDRHTLGEGVTDSLSVAMGEDLPATPSATVDGDDVQGSAFDGFGQLQAAHWVIEDCDQQLVEERWIRRFEEYDGEVVALSPTALDVDHDCFFAQVRYRDAALRWSEFSPLAPEFDDARSSDLCACDVGGGAVAPWLLVFAWRRRR